MKAITVRDLRQRWPTAESLLQTERELVVTRDGRPVARLVRWAEAAAKRRRFDPGNHLVWQRRVFGTGTTIRWSERALESARRDRRPQGDA